MRGHNSTIRLKEKICVRCGKPCIWFSNKMCHNCARIESVLAADEKESDKIIQEEDLSGLIADADAIFSKFIRLKYADKDGLVKCFTCDIKKHWTLMQNGHFVKRGNLFLRFDERNCRPQESICNEINYGMPAEFLRRLNTEQDGLGDILLEEARLVHKPSREEIRNIISEYTMKVKNIKLSFSK